MPASGSTADTPSTASLPPKTRAEALIGACRETELHIMSLNVCFDGAHTLPGQADHWPERLPALQKVIKLERPTVLGVQEALFHQLGGLEEALPRHYRMIGFGRHGGSSGEYSSIFYDAHRLTVLSWDQFWLSDSSRAMGSASWGNYVPRIVTWGRFRDNGTGKELILANTHLDHESENARVQGSRAIVGLMNSVEPQVPAILTGDFNALAETSDSYNTLVGAGQFQDTWAEAEVQVTPAYGTYPHYKDPMVGGHRIDWVLASTGVQVLKAAINTFRLNGRYPSDHVPVQALVRLP